jgi:hypothetical protein
MGGVRVQAPYGGVGALYVPAHVVEQLGLSLESSEEIVANAHDASHRFT